MEVLVEKITDEPAGNVLGAIAAATIPDTPKKKSCTLRFPNKSAPAVTSAAEADLISDLVHKIENLKKPDAIARLLELEDAHEKTYFEIGGVLSVMQRGKWFDPCASLDEWVENYTAMKRSKARALIQIYNAIVDSRITWGQVKHIEWTKLRNRPGAEQGKRGPLDWDRVEALQEGDQRAGEEASGGVGRGGGWRHDRDAHQDLQAPRR
jgi:hypothetical protein